MIEKLGLKHVREEYLECLEDLIDHSTNGSQITPVDIFYNRVKQNNNYEVYVYIMDDRIVATAAIVYEYKLNTLNQKRT